jgi:ATP-dependent helicase HrpA
VLDSAAQQWGAMWRGTRKLLRIVAPPPLKSVQGRLSNQTKLALSRNPHGGVAPLLDDCVTAAIDKVIIDAGGPAWDRDAFEKLRKRAQAELPGILHDTLVQLEPVLRSWYEIDRKLRGITNVLLVRSVSDLRQQLDGLVHKGFVTGAGLRRLPDLKRYLAGMELRLSKLEANPQRDRQWLLKLDDVLEEYADAKGQVSADTLQQVRWMIEELRISYFAQEIGTAYPISDVRIYRALAG